MLEIIWLIIAVPCMIFAGILCYGKPGERRPLSQIQPGNKRSAALVGILYGACWPVWIVIALGVLVYAWVERGAPKERNYP